MPYEVEPIENVSLRIGVNLLVPQAAQEHLKFTPTNPDGNCLIESLSIGLSQPNIKKIAALACSSDNAQQEIAEILLEPKLGSLDSKTFQTEMFNRLTDFAQLHKPENHVENQPEDTRLEFVQKCLIIRRTARALFGYVALRLACKKEYRDSLALEMWEFLESTNGPNSNLRKTLKTLLEKSINDVLKNSENHLLKEKLFEPQKINETSDETCDVLNVAKRCELNEFFKTHEHLLEALLQVYFKQQSASMLYDFGLGTIQAITKSLGVDFYVLQFARQGTNDILRLIDDISHRENTPTQKAPVIIFYNRVDGQKRYPLHGNQGGPHGDAILPEQIPSTWLEKIEAALLPSDTATSSRPVLVNAVPAVGTQRTPAPFMRVDVAAPNTNNVSATPTATQRIPTPFMRVNVAAPNTNNISETPTATSTAGINVTETDYEPEAGDISDAEIDVPDDESVAGTVSNAGTASTIIPTLKKVKDEEGVDILTTMNPILPRVADLVPYNNDREESNRKVLEAAIEAVFNPHKIETRAMDLYSKYISQKWLARMQPEISDTDGNTVIKGVAGLKLKQRIKRNGHYEEEATSVPSPEVTEAHLVAQLIDTITDYQQLYLLREDDSQTFEKIIQDTLNETTDIGQLYKRIEKMVKLIDPSAQVKLLKGNTLSERMQEFHKEGANVDHLHLVVPDSPISAFYFSTKYDFRNIRLVPLSSSENVLKVTDDIEIKVGIGITVSDALIQIAKYAVDKKEFSPEEQMEILDEFIGKLIEHLQKQLEEADKNYPNRINDLKRDIALVVEQWVFLHGAQEDEIKASPAVETVKKLFKSETIPTKVENLKKPMESFKSDYQVSQKTADPSYHTASNPAATTVPVRLGGFHSIVKATNVATKFKEFVIHPPAQEDPFLLGEEGAATVEEELPEFSDKSSKWSDEISFTESGTAFSETDSEWSDEISLAGDSAHSSIHERLIFHTLSYDEELKNILTQTKTDGENAENIISSIRNGDKTTKITKLKELQELEKNIFKRLENIKTLSTVIAIKIESESIKDQQANIWIGQINNIVIQNRYIITHTNADVTLLDKPIWGNFKSDQEIQNLITFLEQERGANQYLYGQIDEIVTRIKTFITTRVASNHDVDRTEQSSAHAEQLPDVRELLNELDNILEGLDGGMYTDTPVVRLTAIHQDLISWVERINAKLDSDLQQEISLFVSGVEAIEGAFNNLKTTAALLLKLRSSLATDVNISREEEGWVNSVVQKMEFFYSGVKSRAQLPNANIVNELNHILEGLNKGVYKNIPVDRLTEIHQGLIRGAESINTKLDSNLQQQPLSFVSELGAIEDAFNNLKTIAAMFPKLNFYLNTDINISQQEEAGMSRVVQKMEEFYNKVKAVSLPETPSDNSGHHHSSPGLH